MATSIAYQKESGKRPQDASSPLVDDDAEMALIGTLLGNREALDDIVQFYPDLSAASFYRIAHRAIFTAIIALHQAGQPVDVVTVTGWLQDHHRLADVQTMVGSLHVYLDCVPSYDYPGLYAERVLEMARRRHTNVLLGKMAAAAVQGKVDEYARLKAELDALDTPDAEEAQQRFQPYRLNELLERPVPPWVWRGIYRAGTRWYIYGPSYSGKSLLAGDLALSFATGLDWQEEKTLQAGVVVYVAAEDASGVARQAKTWLAAHNKQLSDVADTFFIIEDAVDLLDSADVARLIARIKALHIKPDLVVLDTFTECFSGNFIDNQQLRLAFQGIGAIEKALQCGSLTIGHTNKEGLAHLGGMYIKANVHVMAELTQDDKGILHLRCDKLRGAQKFKERTYKLRVAEDEEGDTVAVIVPAKNVPVSSGHLPHLQHLALLALKDDMTATGWHRALGEGSSSAFYEAVKELGLAGYVTKDEHRRYHLTEKAQQYRESLQITPKNSNGVIWSEGQSDTTTPLHSTHPIGCGVDGVVEQPLPEESVDLTPLLGSMTPEEEAATQREQERRAQLTPEEREAEDQARQEYEVRAYNALHGPEVQKKRLAELERQHPRAMQRYRREHPLPAPDESNAASATPPPQTLPAYEPVEAAPVNQAPQSAGTAALALTQAQIHGALEYILAWAQEHHYPDTLTPYGHYDGEIGPNGWLKVGKLSDEQLIQLETYLRALSRRQQKGETHA